jgi:hypothetical protein
MRFRKDFIISTPLRYASVGHAVRWLPAGPP